MWTCPLATQAKPFSSNENRRKKKLLLKKEKKKKRKKKKTEERSCAECMLVKPVEEKGVGVVAKADKKVCK